MSYRIRVIIERSDGHKATAESRDLSREDLAHDAVRAVAAAATAKDAFWKLLRDDVILDVTQAEQRASRG